MNKFDDNKTIKTYSTKVLIKRLFGYIKPYKGKFILALILTLFTVLMDLLPALIQGSVIGILALNPNEEATFDTNLGEFVSMIMDNFNNLFTILESL